MSKWIPILFLLTSQKERKKASKELTKQVWTCLPGCLLKIRPGGPPRCTCTVTDRISDQVNVCLRLSFLPHISVHLLTCQQKNNRNPYRHFLCSPPPCNFVQTSMDKKNKKYHQKANILLTLEISTKLAPFCHFSLNVLYKDLLIFLEIGLMELKNDNDHFFCFENFLL